MTVLGTSQCTATVLNESSTLVNWSVSSSSGSSSGQIGSITTGGLYTAPQQVPTNNVVVVTATSQVDASLTATQNLTLEQATQIAAVTCDDESTGLPVSVVSSGNSLVCTATASTGATVAVNWTVTNKNGLGGNVGSLPATGVYTAPLVPPPGSVVTITATSQSLSTITMSVNVTIVFGNDVLSGNYAFSTSGRLTNKSFWARVGSLSAGGGSLSGIEDTNQGGTPNIVTTNRTFSGSYNIGPDGRGTMQFCESAGSGSPAPASCPVGSGAATSFFRVVVVSPTLVQLIEFSSPQTSAALLTAGGEMLSQDSSIFSAGTGVLSGVYSLTLNGVSSAGVDEAAVGDFAANGFGTISPGSSTAPGQIDLNVSGSGNTTTTLPGTTYAVSSNGRGTTVLNGLTFAFYPVSASRARFIEIDPIPPSTAQSSILLGDAYLQQAAQSCAWGTANALSGTTVLETTGLSSGIVTQDLASFTPSNGAVSGVSMDQNSGGAYTQSSGSPGDNYTISPCGRGTLSIGSHSYVYYIIAPSDAALLETTSGVETYGFLLPSSGGPFALTTLSGSYAFRLGGTDAAGAAGDREDFAGQFTSAGSGSGVAGTLDQNDFGATTGSAGAAIANGTYAAPGGLRATVSLPVATSPASTRNLVLYMVSPTLFYALDVDQAPSGTALGVIDNQF